VLPDFADAVEEHETVKQVLAQGEAGDLFTLDECFQLYTQEEHVRVPLLGCSLSNDLLLADLIYFILT
jgi:hypothetical protein